MRHSGVIALDYIQTSKNLADPFTKGLSRNMIDKCIEGDGYETHMSCHGSNPTYVIGDPVK